MTLAETKAELGIIRARQEIHRKECACRNWPPRLRSTCEERGRLDGEAKRLSAVIKTWFGMPADAEGLF